MARSGSGERKCSLIRSLDYDCVRRFRLRRLLAFLWQHSYYGAFQALSKETTVLFRVEYLQSLVRHGLWSEAIKYVHRFLRAGHLPRGAKLLVKFIRFVSHVSECNMNGSSTSYIYNPYSSLEIYLHGGVSPGGVKLANIISSVRSENVWSSINWPHVRHKAAEIVGHLVAQIPELNDMRRLPVCPVKPANVLPIEMSSRGHRRFQKKTLGQIPASDLARSFLSKKRLPSPSHGMSYSGTPLEPVTMTRVAHLIEECLQAGNYMVLNGKDPSESPYTEGTKLIAGSVVHHDVLPENNPKAV